jgi:enoyl-CoA hydratase/carnithine racemase
MQRCYTRLARICGHLTGQPVLPVVSSQQTANFNGQSFKNLLLDINEKVAIVTLHRPQALNALCEELALELLTLLNRLDRDDNVHVIIITGNSKAFAAGADIKEMADRTIVNMRSPDQTLNILDQISKIQKPLIAAVRGYALGGGCELAMMCDLIVAGESAKFGQPEVKIGTIPGLGGTQRLVRAIGKAKAMEMILTGNAVSAVELERAGLITRVVPDDRVLDESLQLAKQIAAHSRPIVALAKECVNQSFELSLTEGNLYERRVFHSTFGLADQKEGMRAFIEKRTPQWKHQ